MSAKGMIKNLNLISEQHVLSRQATYTDNLDIYKFYLSFENSRCENYVTEKFFSPFEVKNGPIPVALGGTNLKDYSRLSTQTIY